MYDVNASLPNILTEGTFTYVYGLGLTYAVDTSGHVQVYQTDEFGVPTSSQGTSSQPFGYTGQQVDGNGLVFLGARYYDPTSGRFLSRDPLFGSLVSPLSLNGFSYVLNNPVALVDPSGLSSSQVMRNGSTDSECFSTAGGLFPGYVVNARCLNMPMGGRVIIAIVQTPMGPRAFSTIVFARPPQGGSGQNDNLLNRLNRENPGRYTNDESVARRALRLTRIQFRTAMHAVKYAAFRATNPDVIIDTWTGDVLAPRSGDVVGNLLDELR